MNYTIIGTAGHIDHGKSSLIKALNGFWGDENKEEQKRGITIDLSFSYLHEKDKTLAFIDVPGHEKLVSTMISGAYGFDACLLVVDINEGLKPQSIEHLHVLEFLKIQKIIIVFTKCDLIDKKQIEKNTLQIKQQLSKFWHLQILQYLHVSIYDENSIKSLKNALLNIKNSPKNENTLFRCYIDRVFTIKGSGCVVTGTISSGEVQINDKIYIPNIDKMAIVKNIQIHNDFAQKAQNAQRVALNLAKISHSELKKGMLLTKKGYLRGFKSVDLFFKCINGAKLTHNMQVSLHVGSFKVVGKILLFDEHLDVGFCTFKCDEELFLAFEDRCVLSFKAKVIAGGYVLNCIQDPMKKKDKLQLLNALHAKDFRCAFLHLCNIHKKGFGLISAYQRFGLTHEKSLQIAQDIDEIYTDCATLNLYHKEIFIVVKKIILDIFLKNEHALISEKSINLKHKWISENLAKKCLLMLQNEKKVEFFNGVYTKNGVDPKEIIDNIENKIYQILQEGDTAPLAPYNIYDLLDIDRKTGDDAFKNLTKNKKIIRLEHNLFITSTTLSKVMKMCEEIISLNGYIDIANFKQKLNLSRKYLIAYLENLDKYDNILKDGVKRYFK